MTMARSGKGTRVIEGRHAENGVSAFSNLSVNALFGGPQAANANWSTA